MSRPDDRDPSAPGRRALLRAAGIAAVAGLASACARIPTDSEITVRELAGEAQAGAPYVRALPPAEDATPSEVVLGFVQAGVGPEDDYAVAREYLTEDLARTWDPGEQVTIYSGSQELQVESVDEASATLLVQVVASVTSGGLRSLLAGVTPREVPIGLTQVDGQWRISDVPDGIFLSEAAFDTLYASARLYFVDPRQLHLVPDQRWFSLNRGASAVLAALAAGPSPYLDGAVVSEVPASSGVAAAVVTSGADGVVQVEVPTAVGQLDLGRRAIALRQIEASLRSMSTLSGVRLTWEGDDLTPAGEDAIQRALPGHRPIAAATRGVISLTDTDMQGLPVQLVPALASVAVAAPAIAQDGILAAALGDEDAVVLVTSTDGSLPLREAASGGVFVAPRIDDAGYVWTGARASSGVLLALSGVGADADVKIDAPFLSDREVLSLDIAADATRLLVLSADSAGSRLDLCAVRRDADGVPVSLTEPIVIRAPQMSGMTRAGWYDEVAMLVLGEDTGAQEQRAQVLDLANGRDPLPDFGIEVISIAGTSVAETVWAGTVEGTLLRSDGEGWAGVDLTATDPAFY
ncbi:LpqB family beta-propeller domain-containing protein [Brachybacterium sp. DNPG3]